MTDQQTEPEAPKVLRFPSDRSAGMLQLSSRTERRSVPAMGEIKVEPGTYVALTMPHQVRDGEELPGYVPGDLSVLDELDPDALKALHVEGELGDDDLVHVRNLAGLSQLNLSGVLTFTDAGVAALDGLAGLESLVVRTSTLPPALVKAFPALPELRVLYLLAETFDGLSADDMSALVTRLPSLRRLSMPNESGPLADWDNVIALYEAKPGLEVNGVGMSAEIMRRFDGSPSADKVGPAPELPDDGSAVKPLALTADNFDETIAAQKPTLVDFWAEWCGPCRAIAPVIEGLAHELKDSITVAKANTDEMPEMWERFGIGGIPTLLVFCEGEVILRLVGSRPREGLLAYLQPLL